MGYCIKLTLLRIKGFPWSKEFLSIGRPAIPSVDAAKKIADAFNVSLDYLVGEGINASFDKLTVQRLQEIQGMDTAARNNLFAIIDAVIRDYKTRQAYAS